ncbi:hypothetical protein KIPB_000196 [Kipferlia bialata]|uniref:Uncharacterized protein n=1 Tax=Kipferlia bialata TaxID=797122 RepID=A0A391NRG4_9EUKA|nr:hypothetical protein KIPB_000196 [Kipferlia bialata]|eukprot:g196.t1
MNRIKWEERMRERDREKCTVEEWSIKHPLQCDVTLPPFNAWVAVSETQSLALPSGCMYTLLSDGNISKVIIDVPDSIQNDLKRELRLFSLEDRVYVQGTLDLHCLSLDTLTWRLVSHRKFPFCGTKTHFVLDGQLYAIRYCLLDPNVPELKYGRFETVRLDPEREEDGWVALEGRKRFWPKHKGALAAVVGSSAYTFDRHGYLWRFNTKEGWVHLHFPQLLAPYEFFRSGHKRRIMRLSEWVESDLMLHIGPTVLLPVGRCLLILISRRPKFNDRAIFTRVLVYDTVRGSVRNLGVLRRLDVLNGALFFKGSVVSLHRPYGSVHSVSVIGPGYAYPEEDMRWADEDEGAVTLREEI